MVESSKGAGRIKVIEYADGFEEVGIHFTRLSVELRHETVGEKTMAREEMFYNYVEIIGHEFGGIARMKIG